MSIDSNQHSGQFDLLEELALSPGAHNRDQNGLEWEK